MVYPVVQNAPPPPPPVRIWVPVYVLKNGQKSKYRKPDKFLTACLIEQTLVNSRSENELPTAIACIYCVNTNVIINTGSAE